MNAGKKPEDCKMVARAIFSFQAQNNRELSFKKGDIIYIKKQVRSNMLDDIAMCTLMFIGGQQLVRGRTECNAWDFPNHLC